MGKLLYLILLIVWLLLLTFLYSVAVGITDTIISWMPKTYTVEQDETRDMWANIFHCIVIIAAVISVPVYLGDKIEKLKERFEKK